MSSGARTGRTPEQIRSDIEATREQLAYSVEGLRGRVSELTDWRRQLADHRQVAVVGAVAAGFLIGGGLAAFGGLLRRRRA